MILKIVLLAICLLQVSAYTEEDGILVLSGQDLGNITSLFPQIFIKYYVPWCRHCQQLAPVYKEIAQELQRMNSTIRLAKIDCEEHERAYDFQSIQHFPSLVFYNQGEGTNFDGDRTKGYILKWLTKRLVSPVKEISKEEYDTLKDSQNAEVSLVFHGELESIKGATFTNIAYQDNYNNYYFIKEQQLKPYGTVSLLRSFADDVEFPYPNDDFPAWIAEHDRPAVVPLDDRSISSLFRDGKVGVLLFLESQFSDKKGEFLAAAETWKSKKEPAKLIFVDVPQEHQDYFGLLKYMDVNPRETPVVIVDSEAEKKYLLDLSGKEMQKEKILTFLNDFAQGKVASSQLESQHAHHHHDHQHQHHHHDHDHHHHHHHHEHDHEHHHHQHDHDHEHHHHDHEHDHDHDHDHDHSNCGHDHSHQHSHDHKSDPSPTKPAETPPTQEQPLPQSHHQQAEAASQFVSIQL